MASRVVMPKLTDTMEEGVVIGWKKREGDPIAAGDVLAEIETDKAVMDLEAFASGTVRKLLAQEGATVKAGALIAVIGEPDEDISQALEDTIAAGKTATTVTESTSAKVTNPGAQPAQAKPKAESQVSGSGPKASPRARKLAAERGVSLESIAGTGPEGRIIEEDVQAALSGSSGMAGASASVPHVERQPNDKPLSQMRKAIARAMTQSKAPVPHFYLTAEIDMEAAEGLRVQLKQGRKEHPVPTTTDLIVKTAALALSRHPEINVSFVGDAIRQHRTIDIGIAVGLDDGLLTPVLRNCGGKSLEDIAAETRRLIERAKGRKLQPQEYLGATFSISNLGMFGVDNFIAVLMPPEAAALAVGAIRDMPVVEKGTVTTGRRMQVTLSCDHRVLDGMQAARFLRELKRILEHPVELTAGEGSA